MSSLRMLMLVTCLSRLHHVTSQRLLGKYNVDRSQISVSGISSGGAMATQMHVAYSSIFMGVGVIAGNPYYCAQGSTLTATTACVSRPENIDISELTTQTTTYASRGDVDPTNNMYNDRVYVFGGALDTDVDQGVGMKVEQYYYNFVNPDNILGVYNIDAAHTFATMDYGNACSVSADPYISRCSYDTAYELLQHIYGGLTRPTGATSLPGDFYEFDQKEFFYISPPGMSSMDDVGYVYVPSACAAGAACRLHVAFHGCLQGRYRIGDEFARHAGYNAVGELNNIIILYPQVVSSLAVPLNPMGCWDWWGYTVNIYATKGANQPLAVWRMVEKVAY